MTVSEIIQSIIAAFFGVAWLIFFSMFYKNRKKQKAVNSISILDKHKYAFFVIGSFVIAFLASLLVELFRLIDIGFSFLHLLRLFLFYWGLSYPFVFYLYEKKTNKEKDNDKPLEK